MPLIFGLVRGPAQRVRGNVQNWCRSSKQFGRFQKLNAAKLRKSLPARCRRMHEPSTREHAPGRGMAILLARVKYATPAVGLLSFERLLRIAFLALLLPLFALPAVACSVMSCPVKGGIEVRPEFVVTVTHDGKPLPDAKVEVTTASKGSMTFSGVTGSDGRLRVISIPAGDYWLNVEFLGINAAYQCFHIVQSKASRKARWELKYEWGDTAPAMRRVSGRMEDSQPATGGTPLWNISHYVTVPIIGARLQLQNAVTREVFTAVSDDDGAFTFDPLPNGTYVLHIDGRTTGRTYDPTDLLIKLSRDATTTAVVFKRLGPSDCGDIPLMHSWVR